jgi:hypothetical protein
VCHPNFVGLLLPLYTDRDLEKRFCSEKVLTVIPPRMSCSLTAPGARVANYSVWPLSTYGIYVWERAEYMTMDVPEKAKGIEVKFR